MKFQCVRIIPPLCSAFFLLTAKIALAAEEAGDRLSQTAAGLPAHPDQGARTFMRFCAACHGSQGEGDGDRAVPALAAQRFAYLVRQMSHLGSATRDKAAAYHVTSRKRISTPEMGNDIAAYLNRLPPTSGAKTGDGVNVELGRAIFREQCTTCHASDAGGDKEGVVPSLRNQHYDYLVNEMHRVADGRLHDADQSLVLFMRSFNESDISAVADYLSRLHGLGSPHRRTLSNGVVVN